MAEQLALGYVPDDSLSDARSRLLSKLDEGTTCELCGQHAERYSRKFDKRTARALVAIVQYLRARPTESLFAPFRPAVVLEGRVGLGGGNYARAAWWRLLSLNLDDDGRRTGEWRLTDKGLAFAMGKDSIHQVAVVYANQVEHLEGPRIWITDVLKDAELPNGGGE